MAISIEQHARLLCDVYILVAALLVSKRDAQRRPPKSPLWRAEERDGGQEVPLAFCPVVLSP